MQYPRLECEWVVSGSKHKSVSIMRRDFWPLERIELAVKLWTIDGWTARRIGTELGITKNAVIGKMHRMGLDKAIVPGVYVPAKLAPEVIKARAERRRLNRALKNIAKKSKPKQERKM